jgi:hypothetical protein
MGSPGDTTGAEAGVSFQLADGTMSTRPPEGWVVWWQRRTTEVCRNVIAARAQEFDAAVMTALGLQPEQPAQHPSPHPRPKNRKRRRR